MVITKHCEISLSNMFCYLCYIRLWNKIWNNLACLMYRTVSRYRFERKRRKQVPSRKVWMSLKRTSKTAETFILASPLLWTKQLWDKGGKNRRKFFHFSQWKSKGSNGLFMKKNKKDTWTHWRCCYKYMGPFWKTGTFFCWWGGGLFFFFFLCFFVVVT